MGCLFSKATNNEKPEQKTFSWDKRDRHKAKDFIVENVDRDIILKIPGSINGEQFVIQNCKNSSIFVFDHMNTVTIDDCVNCKIILSAVKGSVFVRDTKECVFVVGSGQFRARDCRKLDIFLCCSTQPVIESSSSLHFGCYQLFYDELEEHFQLAGLSIFNNDWSSIHDFTPLEGESNWCLLPDTIQIEDYVSLPLQEELTKINASISSVKSFVPHTWGPHKTSTGISCLVAFFSDGQQIQRAREFIKTMKNENPDCLLLMTREVDIGPTESEKVFRSKFYNSIVQCGLVIGLHYCGIKCIQACQQVAVNIATSTGSTGLVYVSTNPKTSQQQVDDFFSIANLKVTS